jgi:CheY-like chemotaxis protein
MTDTSKIVLCVDDDPDDRDIICYAINEIDPSFKVLHAPDGVKAMELLSKAKSSEELPCLVILDINMPRMDGKQTLAAIKKDERLNDIPVVVFSTSSNRHDIDYCSRYGVELLTKPTDVQTIRHEVKRILQHCS